MNDLKKKFGQRVRQIRLRNNLSQDELSEKIDIAVNNMGKIERGESFVTAATLEKLCCVLNVKAEDFFRFDNFVSLPEMKKELNTDTMSANEIKQLYRFYKLFICES